MTNTGTIEVAAATLDFKEAVTGTGTDTIWPHRPWNSTRRFRAARRSAPRILASPAAAGRSHRSHELLRRDFQLRGGRHGRASWLMGLFRFLREFGWHAGDADAHERYHHARFRLRRRLHEGRFQNHLGSDLDHHTHLTQRRRAGAQGPGGVAGLDRRLRHGRSRIAVRGLKGSPMDVGKVGKLNCMITVVTSPGFIRTRPSNHPHWAPAASGAE